eukprot:NODE_968_length_1196_cov_758.204882_g730_i0.p2 GENE.NODE_968_length_1196_cov_758.204882_g730_i0~~NODE_968_length_1196_cov_758.204882_g730_i0.p2  ORF type:complete len:345 (+),score=113.57 NODE_968_length_1196_cov_758.204882_g730_i0:71-1105(+)
MEGQKKKKTRPAKKILGQSEDDRVYAPHKVSYFTKANALFDEYDKAMVVLCDNVQSRQMQHIRTSLRGKASVLMGKNTMMKKVLLQRFEAGGDRDKILYEKIVGENLLYNNIGLILTNADLKDVKEIVDNNKIQAPARAGAVAPLDVTVPAGNTGLEPTKTSFFQALNIQTKITKGTVEILKDEKVVTEGERVGTSEATLLQMLNIKPFFYGLEVLMIYDNGSVYGPDVLALDDDALRAKMAPAISNVTAISLALGYTTKASAPHVMMNSFKNLLALTLGIEYAFEKHNGADLKDAILTGKCIGGGGGGGGGGSAPAAEAPKEEAKKVEEEEEEDDEMGFGLFD